MITQEIYAYVLPSVRLIVQDLNGTLDGKELDDVCSLVHAKLWPYVTHALREINPAAITEETPKRDGRAKSWQYIVRFWSITPIGPEMIAESDVETMQGTGALSEIIGRYAQEMHVWLVPELSEESIKAKLPQLRNNLGRQGSAVLRVEYSVGDESYLCQVDVAKPGA